MSQTEADKRITALVTDEPEPRLTDRQVILARVSAAPFSNRKQTAIEWAAELHYIVGMPHPRRAGTIGALDDLTSWEAHTVQRIRDGRWPPGTNPGEYLSDLRAAGGHPDARLYVGIDPANGHALAGTLTPMDSPLLRFRKAPNPKGMSMVVVYDAMIGAIRTGFFDVDSDARTFVARWKHRTELGK